MVLQEFLNDVGLSENELFELLCEFSRDLFKGEDSLEPVQNILTFISEDLCAQELCDRVFQKIKGELIS